MMHAFLYIGSTQNIRQQLMLKQIRDWNIDVFDTIPVQTESEHITIDDIRAFTRRLLLAPMKSSHVAGVIYNAPSMTTEAQNALLKILEEPPKSVRILIESDSEQLLLPTIVSRCEIIRVAGENTGVDIPLMKLMDAPIGEKLIMLEEYTKDRIRAKAFVADALHTGEKLLQTGKEASKIALILRRLQKAQGQLAVNCNPKLVLDRVFIN